MLNNINLATDIKKTAIPVGIHSIYAYEVDTPEDMVGENPLLSSGWGRGTIRCLARKIEHRINLFKHFVIRRRSLDFKDDDA